MVISLVETATIGTPELLVDNGESGVAKYTIPVDWFSQLEFDGPIFEYDNGSKISNPTKHQITDAVTFLFGSNALGDTDVTIYANYQSDGRTAEYTIPGSELDGCLLLRDEMVVKPWAPSWGGYVRSDGYHTHQYSYYDPDREVIVTYIASYTMGTPFNVAYLTGDFRTKVTDGRPNATPVVFRQEAYNVVGETRTWVLLGKK